MKATVSEKSLAVIKAMQQNELTESVIYAKIASFAKGEENKKTLLRLSQEEQDRVLKQHPNCWISFAGAQPYGVGWRYDEDEITPLNHYKVVREAFRLNLDPNIPNHVGWYLKDEEREEVNKLEEAMDAALAALKQAAPEETLPEETVPEETVPEETTVETTAEA